MAKSFDPGLESKQFGSFTRQQVAAMLGESSGREAALTSVMAATALATLDPHGRNPGTDFISVAVEALAKANTSLSGDLLWQAAEHAQNARVRIEAIRRSGPIADENRRQLLRNWASTGFAVRTCYEGDRIDVDAAKAASLMALGEVSTPTGEDIEAVTRALSPQPAQGEFSPEVFDAAAEAYWKIGDLASLSTIMEWLLHPPNAETSLKLTALAAKFSTEELTTHGDALRRALLRDTGAWRDGAPWDNRLLDIAKKLFTSDFLQEWASTWGRDGLNQARGRMTSSLLTAARDPDEKLAIALVTLAQWQQNLASKSPVVAKLVECTRAGHGKTIVKSMIDQRHEGHQKYFESGDVFSLYESIDAALSDMCEAIAARPNENDQGRVAERVAIGSLCAVNRRASGDADDPARGFDLAIARIARKSTGS